ncbi:DUF1403 family protein [uncultured Maritimibacter sp.]|jgi:hypothetical protein|uniref:DUF1403 family protein n=1 Tax=uncultured Maritimibacter sp. TaxID=991866 RepID=UPI000ADEA336|nr:DUF1403 family protein [uncultured Maritimibacter sp.]
MTKSHAKLIDDTQTIARMPGWVTSSRHETPEDVAFLSGAALATLQAALSRSEVPHALLRDRMALRAAQTCVGFSGRGEGTGDLRDAVHLTRPGDLPGPAGETYALWRRAVERPLSPAGLRRALPGVEATRLADWLDAGGGGGPVARAAQVLGRVLDDAPREGDTALILAEATLARALGWDHLLPLITPSVSRADLRKRGDDLRRACHRAMIATATETIPLAADLSRRAAHLRRVAPKLRAKGAGPAVEMFLTRDAVAPAALPLPDRAARRLCDRLVDLGAVRELTGRDSFRLYGL